MKNDKHCHARHGEPENGRENRVEEKNRENRKALRQRRRNIREELLADTLRIPADVCEGTVRVTLTGNTRAWVENYRGILEYTDRTVLLQGKSGRVCFEGEGLCIEYYTGDDMMIRGRIKAVKLDP